MVFMKKIKQWITVMRISGLNKQYLRSVSFLNNPDRDFGRHTHLIILGVRKLLLRNGKCPVVFPNFIFIYAGIEILPGQMLARLYRHS